MYLKLFRIPIVDIQMSNISHFGRQLVFQLSKLKSNDVIALHVLENHKVDTKIESLALRTRIAIRMPNFHHNDRFLVF